MPHGLLLFNVLVCCCLRAPHKTANSRLRRISGSSSRTVPFPFGGDRADLELACYVLVKGAFFRNASGEETSADTVKLTRTSRKGARQPTFVRRLFESGVAVEKLSFGQNSRNLRDRKCLRKRRSLFVGKASAMPSATLRVWYSRNFPNPAATSALGCGSVDPALGRFGSATGNRTRV
jgi:hypothetical protein